MSNELTYADDAVERLELEVARRRERLTSTLQNLRSELKDVSHWRHWYVRHPLGFLVGAALAGWTTGLVLSPRRR